MPVSNETVSSFIWRLKGLVKWQLPTIKLYEEATKEHYCYTKYLRLSRINSGSTSTIKRRRNRQLKLTRSNKTIDTDIVIGGLMLFHCVTAKISRQGPCFVLLYLCGFSLSSCPSWSLSITNPTTNLQYSSNKKFEGLATVITLQMCVLHLFYFHPPTYTMHFLIFSQMAQYDDLRGIRWNRTRRREPNSVPSACWTPNRWNNIAGLITSGTNCFPSSYP